MGGHHVQRHRVWLLAAAFAVAVLTASALASAANAAEANSYVVHNLVSDVPGAADRVDPNLVNAWGLASLPTSPWWVADNGTEVSTLYQANGTPAPLVVSVDGGAPTGLVANPGSRFVVSAGGTSGSARFIFDTEDGAISAWSPGVTGTHAIVVATSPGAIYKGLAIASSPAGDFLYAADFHHARVDMFNDHFALATRPGAFVDPKLPAGFAPFGITNIGGQIFVSYAKQDADQEDEVAGQGLGFVDAFDTSGNFIGRVATRGQLNAPWGLARAPANFGAFGGDLLVGNFGDGEINAYEPQPDGTYERVGALKRPDHKPILIDGLWALAFGKGGQNGTPDTLFFTAGPDDETHGLFGTIKVG
jgi:uncharacterized protein (TIGR03118 family)